MAYELTDRDREVISTIGAAFQRRPENGQPQPGDAVEVHHPTKGLLYRTAHIEGNWYGEEGTMTICTQASGRFVSVEGGQLAFSTSGGYWRTITAEQLPRFERIGRIEKSFWTWGSRGVGAGRGVYFSIEVNLWRYTDEQFY